MPQKASRNHIFITQLRPYAVLERHETTGIARIVDGSSGTMATCHPNIDASGSVAGMRNLGYWNRTDRVVRSGGYIYNVSNLVVSDQDDRIAALACRCGGRCAEYQESVGFGPGARTDAPEALIEKAIQIPADREVARLRQQRLEAESRIPDEDAELVLDVDLSIVVYLDPENLPPVGSDERKRILAEHVLEFIQTIGGDLDILAECINGESLLERRDISGKAARAKAKAS